MASKSEDRGGGGCAALLAIVVAIIVVLWTFSTIGHALGLTPTYSELTDRPDGWVGKHYRGVVWGYLLTVAALATAGILAWLAIRTRSDDPRQAVQTREWLRHAATWAFVLFVAILFLPVGQRAGVDTHAGASGPARAGSVPDVIGLSVARAEAQMGAAGLEASVEAGPFDAHRCRVFAQDPDAGAGLPEHRYVDLRCRARIPRVVGMRPVRAELRLAGAGFHARYPYLAAVRRCRVVRQSRSGALEPGATIRLGVRCAKPKSQPAPATPPPSNCDPNYSGCLKPDSPDYDCAGGSGDGPDYTGPVTVVGDDRHGLDSDGDGSACE